MTVGFPMIKIAHYGDSRCGRCPHTELPAAYAIFSDRMGSHKIIGIIAARGRKSSFAVGKRGRKGIVHKWFS
jgi:hypothetical protein